MNDIDKLTGSAIPPKNCDEITNSYHNFKSVWFRYNKWNSRIFKYNYRMADRNKYSPFNRGACNQGKEECARRVRQRRIARKSKLSAIYRHPEPEDYFKAIDSCVRREL